MQLKERNERRRVCQTSEGVCVKSGRQLTEEDGRPAGKLIDNRIFGSDGFLEYSGVDHRRESGKLFLRRHGYEEDVMANFDFEEGEQDGTGPLSLQAFIAGCQGVRNIWNGCDAEVGFLPFDRRSPLRPPRVSRRGLLDGPSTFHLWAGGLPRRRCPRGDVPLGARGPPRRHRTGAAAGARASLRRACV